MKIVVCHFEYGTSEVYDQLSQVFEYSVKKNAPHLTIEIVALPPKEKEIGKIPNFAANTIKLDVWNDIMASATEPIIFCDADLLLLRDPTLAFELDFDLCFTKRTSKIPFNGGVVFARPTENAKEFFINWKKFNNKMYEDNVFHRIWRKKYAGMNQAALGYLLETTPIAAKIEYLPCATWNACDEDWANLREDVVFLHIKGRLRDAVIGNWDRGIEYYRKAAEVWRLYDSNMRTEYQLPPRPPIIKSKESKRFEPMQTPSIITKPKFKRKPPSKPRFIEPQELI
jgi:hypothetical protein